MRDFFRMDSISSSYQILVTLFAGSAGSAGLGVEQTKTLFLVEELKRPIPAGI